MENIDNMDKNKQKRKLPSFGKICVIFLIIFVVTIISARYIADSEFRQSVDTSILHKDLTSENVNTIDINSEFNPTICAYNKHIAVLSKSVLNIYDTGGKIVNNIDINLYSPLTAANGSYLVLAENEGSKIYVVHNTSLAWQTELSGTITRVNVNQNGYVSVIINNSTYKSVVIFFDNYGNEIFRNYLAQTCAICSDISQDNKYLAIGEVDYSGTIIKSYVRIISVDKAKQDPDNAKVYRYTSEAGEVITNIKYSDKQNAVCMFNSYIQNITPTGDTRVLDINNDIIFADINMMGNIALVEKQSSGLFSYDYQMRIMGANSFKNNLFILSNSMPKTITCNGEKVCINYGNEIQIVNSSGWLLKRYTPHSEIKSVVLSDNIVGIIYKDEIDIINF